MSKPFRYTRIGHWLHASPETQARDRALVITMLTLAAIVVAAVATWVGVCVILHANPFSSSLL